MLFHLSIPARAPETVARAIAELWRGHASPFPIYEGGWIAFALDDRNSAVEVVPYGLAFTPDGRHVPSDAAQGAPGVHFAMASPLDAGAIAALAGRQGWTCRRCMRSGFEVMELWLEDSLMIEVLTSEMQADYLKMDVAELCEKLGAPIPALE